MNKKAYKLIKEAKQKTNELRSLMVNNICAVIEETVRIKDEDSQQILLPYPVMLTERKVRGFNHGSFDFNLFTWLNYSRVRQDAWVEDEDGHGVLLTDLPVGELYEVLKVVETWAKEE